MMTSNKSYSEAFAWIWLPEETKPVITGKLEKDIGNLLFSYGKSYLETIHHSPQAISIYGKELL